MGFQVTSRLQARNKEKCGADSSEDKRAAEETLPEVVGHADGGPDRKKGPGVHLLSWLAPCARISQGSSPL